MLLQEECLPHRDCPIQEATETTWKFYKVTIAPRSERSMVFIFENFSRFFSAPVGGNRLNRILFIYYT